MRCVLAAMAACLVAVFAAPAEAAECPGNPNALGTSRTIVVDPLEHARIGTMQYRETLPLDDKEVVLTFDDGPLPPNSTRVLDILAAQCVKATFFIVGEQARAFPSLVRRAFDEGHTIAMHSQHHPRGFGRLSLGRVNEEFEQGLASTAAALGDPHDVAPFFRIPGLSASATTEGYMASRGVMIWSADFPADDWRHISSRQVLKRALDRLEKNGKGVLLLHDIQPATAIALPDLLKELKARGYRIVHVVPSGPDRPKTVTEPAQWVMHHQAKPAWPSVVAAAGRQAAEPQLPVPSPESFGWPHLFAAKPLVPTQLIRLALVHRRGHQLVRIVPAPAWPAATASHVTAAAEQLPIPSPQSFGIPHPFGPNIVLPGHVAAGHPDASRHSALRFAPVADQKLAGQRREF